MTGLNIALTGPEQTALSKPTTRKTYLSVVSNIVQATGVVAGIAGFPTADVVMLSTSVGWSGIKAGMTVLITSSGGVMRGYYRVRSSAAGHLYIGEVGRGDPGLLTQSIHLDVIQGSDLVTVYNRFDIWAVMPRIVYSGGTAAQIFEDYNLTVGTENTYPDPMVQVTSNGKPDHGAGRVDAGQTYRTVVLVALGLPWPTSGSITYLWTTGLSVVGGGIHTNTITVRVPAGSTQQTVQLDVTESNGGAQTRYIHLWSYDFVTYFPFEITAVQSDSRDRSYRRMTLSLFDNGLANIPDGSMVHVWDETTCGSTDGATISITDRFSGWLIRDQRQIEAGLRSADADIVGPGGLMASLNANSQYVTAISGTPGSWQQVKNTLSNIDWIIWWMIRRRSTVLNLFSYVPIGVTGSDGRMSAWDVPTGTLLQQCQTLALRYGCNFGTDSYGQICVRPIPNLYPYSGRGSAIVTRDSVSIDDFMAINPSRQYKPHVRRLRGEAFFWDGSSTLTTPYLCDSPDNVPAQGDSEETMQSQVVESQDILNRRNGNKLYNDNNPWPQVPTRFDYNRDVYEPAQMQFVHQNIPAAYSPDGLLWDMNTCPLSVSKTYEDGGSSTIELQSEGETAAEFASVTVPVPPIIGLYGPTGINPPYSIISSLGTGTSGLPPVDPTPSEPKTNGSVQIVGDASRIFITQNYLTSHTTWADITPTDLGSFRITHAMFDRFTVSTSQPGVYLLANDGTNSAVWHTPNAFRPSVPWSKGANIVGVFDLIRLTQTQGEIAIYGSGSPTPWSLTFDFKVSDQGWIPFPSGVGHPAVTPAAVYSLGDGWDNIFHVPDGTGGFGNADYIVFTLPVSYEVTAATLTWSAGGGMSAGGGGGVLRIRNNADTTTLCNWDANSLPSSFTNRVDILTTLDGPCLGVGGDTLLLSSQVADGGGNTISFKKLVLSGSTSSSPNSVSSLSTDYGATFDSPVTVGAAPTAVGGFDVQHTGTVELGAIDPRVRTATLGGAYSDEAHGSISPAAPVLILLPWSQFGGSTLNNTGSTPQYLLGASVTVSGESVWAVTGSGQHAVSPDISGTKGLPVGPNSASFWLGLKATLLASISGVVHLFTGVVTSTPDITWTDRGAIANGIYTRGRYLSSTGSQIFIAANNALYYSPDFGVSIYNRPSPIGSGILFLENWG